MNRPLRPMATVASAEPALFLAETVNDLNEGRIFSLGFRVKNGTPCARAAARSRSRPAAAVFQQGDQHKGIWLIEAGIVRTYYAAPSGRQITLAYWPAGHFVGGPEIFGGGEHVWSADVTQNCHLLYLPATAIRRLVETQPSFALCLIEGLVAKGKCYSALVANAWAPARSSNG